MRKKNLWVLVMVATMLLATSCNAASGNANTDTTVETSSTDEDKLQTETEITVESDFLHAIEESVLWRMENSDTTDYSIIVNTELANVADFAEKEFSDKKLQEIANTYINGLNKQKEALAEELYCDYQILWQEGIVLRYEALNDLYTEYDFLSDNSEFKGTYIMTYDDEKGLYDAYVAIEKDLDSQSEDIEYRFDNGYITFTLKNNTDYEYSSVFEISILDDNNKLLESGETYVESIKAGYSYDVSYYVSSDGASGIEWTNYYTDVKNLKTNEEENGQQESEQETEQFIAQGETTLFNFLNASSSYGFEIDNPQKDGVYVNAVAKGDRESFDIQYMVEEQHVYMVAVYTDGTISNEFRDCVQVMGLSINPNISNDSISEAMDYVLNHPDEQYVIEETMFRFDNAENKLTISC